MMRGQEDQNLQVAEWIFSDNRQYAGVIDGVTLFAVLDSYICKSSSFIFVVPFPPI